MKRRDVLINGIRFSGGLYAWALFGGKAWAKEKNTGWEHEISQVPAGLHYSLNILAAYLHDGLLPVSPWPDEAPWKAVYDRFEWTIAGGEDGDGAEYFSANRAAGDFSVVCKESAKQTRYEIRSILDTHEGYLPGSGVKAAKTEQKDGVDISVICSGDSLCSAREWAVRFYRTADGFNPVPDTVIHEQGRCAQNSVDFVSGGKVSRTVFSTRPVVFQQLLPEVIRHLPNQPGAVIEFDMIRDGGIWMPEQRLVNIGGITAEVGSRVISLHGYLLTGRGGQLSHYWLDEANRPVLITHGTVGYALRETGKGTDA